MKKTRVDDILLEMIRPKIEEIEKKFSNGQPLTQDDINTLLLKSQYNHINHLDQKLDETVQSVKALEHNFDLLQERVNNKIASLEQKFVILEERVENRISAMEEKLDSSIQALEQKLDSSILALEQKLDGSIHAMDQKLDSSIMALEHKFETSLAAMEDRMNATIQKALNKNMLSLITIIGFFFTLFKIIDIFAPGH